MSIKIWLDDLRDPVGYGYPEAIWVKNALDFNLLLIDCLIQDDGDSIESIHFDNDIGEKTEGYHLFVRVEALVLTDKLKGLKKVFVHTSNSGAADKFMLAKEGLSHYDVELIRKHY